MVKQKLRSGQPWEPHLIREFEEHVVRGTTALDVGAHIGSLTVPLARLVGPEGRVYAFEPQKHVYRELVHNLRLNELSNAIPLRFAVSSEPRIIEMTPIVIDDGWVRVGEGGDKAEARTIDSFGFSNVSVIKIDFEFHEVEVLKGAEETINAFHPVIFAEIGRQNLKVAETMLAGWGYSLQRLPPWADYIAVFGASPRAEPR
jgi:FkbM family methyltransferase